MKLIINPARLNMTLNVYALLSSVFIMAFLGLFQPFDINNSSTRTIVISIPLIGSFHYTILYIYMIVLRNWTGKVRLSRLQEFYHILVFVSITSVLTKTFHVTLGLSSYTLNQTVDWIYGSLLVMPLPHIVWLFVYNESILTLEQGFNYRLFRSDASANVLQDIDLNQIYYIKAMENYVNVVWKNKGKVEKTMIRSTLTRIEKNLDKQQFLRCHRSYIINLDKDITIEGNARASKILMNIKGKAKEIPLSNKKYRRIKAQLSISNC